MDSTQTLKDTFAILISKFGLIRDAAEDGDLEYIQFLIAKAYEEIAALSEGRDG